MACHGSGLADEGGSHIEKSGWDVTDGSLHIVDEPVLALDGQPRKMTATARDDKKYYVTSNYLIFVQLVIFKYLLSN